MATVTSRFSGQKPHCSANQILRITNAQPIKKANTKRSANQKGQHQALEVNNLVAQPISYLGCKALSQSKKAHMKWSGPQRIKCLGHQGIIVIRLIEGRNEWEKCARFISHL